MARQLKTTTKPKTAKEDLKSRIHIRLKAYDHKVIDNSASHY